MNRTAILFLLVSSASAQPQSAWKAGVAKVNITPREPIWLAGYGDRTRPSEGVRQEIYAKALALQDESGATSVIVTADLLGFTREVAEPIAERARQKYGLVRERLAFNASHTHSAPVTGNMLRPAYPFGEEQMVVIRRYTSRLQDQVVELIGDAIKNLAPAQIAFEQGLAGVAVNRRRVGHRNYPGPVDHDVPVLAVRDLDGKLRAVVFGYACHNTVLNDYQVNGDWAGYAQAEIEQQHPGTTALFMQGCGADANPLPRRSVELAASYGRILAAAVEQVLEGKMRQVSGRINAAFDHVDVPFANPPTRAQFEERLHDRNAAVQRHAKFMLELLNRDGKLPNRYPCAIEVWQLGQDVTWVMLAGEVVVDYALRFKNAYGWDNTWVSGYSNDVFAYIPSLRVLKEGGYEGGGAMIGYGQPGPFAWAVEETIAGKVDELVRRSRGSR
jgi:neutral ceramidase